jgi:hypothetical protein
MHWIHDPDFSEKVARLCTEKYERLPKTGKPQAGKEWTLLSGVVMCIQKGLYGKMYLNLLSG